MLDCLRAHLTRNSVRVLRIDASRGGPVVENADIMSTDALALVARLAAASSAQPLRMQVLLLGSQALRVRLVGVGPLKWLDKVPMPSLKPPLMQQRTRRLRLPLAAVGCLAGFALSGAIRLGDNDRLLANAALALEAPLPPPLSSVAFAGGEVSSTMPPSLSTRPLPTTIEGHSVPPQSGALSPTPQQVQSSSLAPPESAASLPAHVARTVGDAGSRHATEPQTTPSPPTGPLSEEALRRLAELLARSDALLAESIDEIDALLGLRPTKDAARPATERSTSRATQIDPAPPLVPLAEEKPSGATATAAAPPVAERLAAPIIRTEPVQPPETASPSTAAAPSPAEAATKPQRPVTGASPTAVAALLARGDALIAIGDIAAARVVYQRAAAHASARAATATGRTYDPRFLVAIGAIGVVADPEEAAEWYRRGLALGDENALPLLGGLEVKASR
jgi:hypothetical protein